MIGLEREWNEYFTIEKQVYHWRFDYNMHVQKHQGRLLEQRYTDGKTATLTTRKRNVARVSAGLHTHLANHFFHETRNVRLLNDIIEFRRIRQSLTACQVRPMFVMLLHNVAVLFKDFVGKWDAVESHRPSGMSIQGIQRQRRNQSRFPRT